jgi:hypothetical protein
MSRRSRGPGKRWGGPWYGEFRERLRFEGAARQAYKDLRAGVRSQAPEAGYSIQLRVEVPYYGWRQVEVRFQRSAPRMALVRVDGPEDSPHRYRDGSLCMWHPGDGPSQRWEFEDGLLALIGYIIAHLFREAWWRDRGEWLGPEAGHPVPGGKVLEGEDVRRIA